MKIYLDIVTAYADGCTITLHGQPRPIESDAVRDHVASAVRLADLLYHQLTEPGARALLLALADLVRSDGLDGAYAFDREGAEARADELLRDRGEFLLEGWTL